MIKLLRNIFILLLFSANAFSQNGGVIDGVIAIVGGNAIYKSSVETQYLQYKARGYQGSGKNLRCEIFEEQLFQKLLINQAAIDSIEVSDKEVESEMENRLKMFINQIGSQEKLEEYFNKSIFEIKDEFREVIKDQLITQRMQAEITGELKITPAEVSKFFRNIPKDSLPMINLEYEILQIVKNPPINENAKKVVKDKLNGFRERILKGENFSTLAVLYSEDPGSATNGGELGFVNRTDLVPEFAAVAFNMTDKNEVSRIVETEYGFHIIQLIERKGEKVNVRHILMKPKVSPSDLIKARTFLDSLSTVIRTDTLTFEQAAIFHSEDEETRMNGGIMINPYTGTSKFETSHLDPATNYALKDLKIGQISSPFEAQDQQGQKVYKIIKLRSKTEPHVASLKEDYQRIQDMALVNKQNEVIDKWVKEKQRSSYIRIIEEYRGCPFNYAGWLK